jgi:sugar-specific transcriptional regulator TrmB
VQAAEADRAQAPEEEVLLEALHDFGLDFKEARVYLTLLRQGPMRASSVAAVCNLRRGDAYRILARLRDHGYVEAGLEQPITFRATPVGRVVDLNVEELRTKAERISRRKTELLRLAGTATPGEPGPEREAFRVVQGRTAYFELLERLIRHAKQEVCLKTTRNGLARLATYGLDAAVREAQAQGVRFRLLAPVESRLAEALSVFRVVAEIRHASTEQTGEFITIDGMETVIGAFVDDSQALQSPRDTFLWLTSRGYATAMAQFFAELWTDAPTLDEALRAVETGVTPPTLRLLRGEEEVRSQREALCGRAERSLDALWHEPIALNIVPIQRRLRLLTPIGGSEAGQRLRDVLPLEAVRHLPADLPLDLLLVDGRYLLVEFHTDEGRDELRAYVADDPALTALFGLVYNHLWEAGVAAEIRLAQLQTARRTDIVIERCASALRRGGLDVTLDTMLVGRGERRQRFALVAQTADQRVYAIDVYVGDRPLEAPPVADLCAKVGDVYAKGYLVAVPGVAPGAVGLLQFFGVDLIAGENEQVIAEALSVRIREHMQTSPTSTQS